MADAGVWDTCLLGVAFRLVICEFYLFFLLVRLLSEMGKLPPDPPVRGFPRVWKLSLLRLPSLPGGISIPNSFVSLFIFYILSYFLSKTVASFLGA